MAYCAFFRHQTRAAESSVAAAPPVADTDPIAMIVFVLLMIAMIGGYAVFIWRKERERKEQGHE